MAFWVDGAPCGATGPSGNGERRKVHLAMDTATSDTGAVESTSSSDGGSPVLQDLLNQIPAGEENGTVTADGAQDTRSCHTAIIDRQPTAIIPIRKTGDGERTVRQPGPKRDLACDTAPWPGVLEAVDRIRCPKPHRGQDAPPRSLG